jgi:hypothetical protein
VTQANTILVVDDDPAMAGYYWEILNETPESNPNSVVPHWVGDFEQFEKMFAQMVADGKRYPLCIVDLTEGNTGNLKRGVETVRVIRGLDGDIGVLISTKLDSYTLAEVREELVADDLLGNSRFFQLHDMDHAEFRRAVDGFIDRWSRKHRLRRSLAGLKPAEVNVSGILKEICTKLNDAGQRIDFSNIVSGLLVCGHHQHLAEGLKSLLSHAVEASREGDLVSVIGDRTTEGAEVLVAYRGARNAPGSLGDLLEASECSYANDLYVLDLYLREADGRLEFAAVEGPQTRIVAQVKSFP